MSTDKNSKLLERQVLQEEEYEFPYHFASRYKPDFAPAYVDHWALNYNLTLELVLDLVRNEKSNSIVDIGCGDGRLTYELDQALPDATITGVDYSERAIQLAKSMSPSVDFENADITQAHSLGQYQTAILMEVLEHVPLEEVDEFIEAVAKLVKVEGLLIVTVPHTNKPLEYKHFQHFTKNGLDNRFSRFFRCEKVIFLEKRGWLNKVLNKIVVNRIFVLNSRKLLNFVYGFYRSQVFQCAAEGKCSRIAVCFRRLSNPELQ